MGPWRNLAVIIALTASVLLNGCDLGWDFLLENGSGGGGNAGAQTTCQNSRVATGQFPPSGGGLSSSGSLSAFTATYSSSKFTGLTSSKALGLRVSRNRLWLNDFSIEVSFFPFDDTDRDPRNGCLGRAILEINIPEEDLFFDNRAIEIQSTRISLTESSAFYAEGGDPGFTSNTVRGTIQLLSSDGGQVEATFELTFNPDLSPRTFTNGQVDDTIDQNPAAEGF